MRIVHPFRVLAVVLGASICLCCQSTAKSKEPTLLVSEPELRSTVDAMATAFSGRIQLEAMQMSSKTSEPEVRRRLLFMKKKTITAIETASDHPKALTSYLDLWSLAYQLELFLERVKDENQGSAEMKDDIVVQIRGSAALKDDVDVLIGLYRDVRLEFEKTAKSFIPPDTYDSVVASVKEYVESYAISGSDGALTRINFSETAMGSVLSPVLNMTMSPFRAMEGVGKGGDAAKDLVTVVKQFVKVAERMPEHLGWEMESLLMDTRRDVEELLTKSDKQMKEVQTALTQVQDTLKDVQAIGTQAESVTASVERTVTALDTSAGSIDTLLKTYKDTMMTLYPPATPEEKARKAAARAAAIAANPDAAPKPFDINDYTKTLAGLTQASTELQALLTEVRSTLEGKDLQNVVDAAGKVTAAALDESSRTVEALMDDLFRKIMQLLLLAFGLALVFLILSRWVIRKKAA